MYFWGLVLMVISIPLSRFMMSLAQFTLSGIMILEFVSMDEVRRFFKRYPYYLSIFLIFPAIILWIIKGLKLIIIRFFRRENLPAIVFFSLYILHAIGLLFTVDFDYALKDLRIKLPLLVLPVIFTVSESLDWKKFRKLMLFFVASVLAGTFISTYILITQDVDNLREISIFISHIRFSLLISIAIFTLAYFSTRQAGFKKHMRILCLFLTGWFIIYLVLSASITGLVVLLVAVFVMAVHYTLKKKNIYSRIATVLILLVPAILLVFLMGIVTDVYKTHKVDFSGLDKQTKQGNYYWHDTTNLQTENGHYIWIYLATDELRDAWNNRSEYDFDSLDSKGQELKSTLIRFMSSKGLRKDAAGVEELSDSDISLVENGEASIHYHERSVFYIRLYKIIWESQQYLHTGDPSGHSAMQRIEYWKTSMLIIKQNPLFGVGTGDMNIAFERQYELMDSPLKLEFRWRSHNQFLSITVGFGIIGILWFLFALFYPPIKLHRLSDYFYLSFFVIMIVSMISEDTIETQAGVTIFAFFTSLFLFGKKDKTTI
ncbi:MAG: O-antigen ligase family protein [Bacteroidales bacterium]|nr:O-antigen ligase family protein [Bacteroidales bacterium]